MALRIGCPLNERQSDLSPGTIEGELREELLRNRVSLILHPIFFNDSLEIPHFFTRWTEHAGVRFTARPT